MRNSLSRITHYALIMFKTIKCNQLDFENTTFVMSYPLRSPAVIASVATVGVLHPIIISGCECQGKYQIVTGFRRAYACREIGIPIMDARLYQVDPENQSAAFLLALYENRAHRTFNDVEKSLILSKLLGQFGCSQDDVIRDYMPVLQLASNAKVLATYLKILDVEEDLKRYIAGQTLPMNVIDLLANLSPDDRNAVFPLIATLKLGTNKTKEFLTYLDEIALRDNCSIHQIIAEQQIQDILTREKYPVPQKAEHIRRVIREKRYPQLTTLERQYHEHLKRLQLPRGLQLKTDRFFEDDQLSATFRFETPKQLKTIAEELLALSQNPELREVLHLIQAEN